MAVTTFHQAVGTLQSHGYICNSTLHQEFRNTYTRLMTRGFRVEIRPLKQEHRSSRVTTCGSIQASSSSYQISAHNPISTPSNGTFEDPSKNSSTISCFVLNLIR
ncbi:hypothetical protein OSB04_005671 [Centaurea solstitialis]|uniref:Uncharacterized protein n=1 Tax=Centaurea solstitialis TaxID=347529 RepID=A0AA38WS88_9ASTR|nr:hypothetical protein OSB04_005671 [Centaurea solstitialis]